MDSVEIEYTDAKIEIAEAARYYGQRSAEWRQARERLTLAIRAMEAARRRKEAERRRKR